MEDCLFCKISKGDMKVHQVYQDDSTMAFMDINPVARGHVLVIPRQHVGEFYELGGAAYSNLMSVIQRLARDMKRRLGAARINIKTVGEHIPDHAHIHLIPVYPDVSMASSVSDEQFDELAQLISG